MNVYKSENGSEDILQEIGCAYILNDVSENKYILELIKHVPFKFAFLNDISEVLEKRNTGNIFITDDFFSDDFLKLKKLKDRFCIMSSFLFREFAEEYNLKSISLFPVNLKPVAIYRNILIGIKICFTGFVDASYMNYLGRIVQYLGGKLSQEMIVTVTHLVAKSVLGAKARYAIGFRVPILSEKWILEIWERRNEENLDIYEIEKNCFLKPLEGVHLHFIGFHEDELSDATKYLLEFGGDCVPLDNNNISLIVVADHFDIVNCNDINIPVSIDCVKEEWFWHCIERKCFEEWDDYILNQKKPKLGYQLKSFPSVFQNCNDSFNNSELDISDLRLNQENSAEPKIIFVDISKEKYNDKKQQIFMEILETEASYISVLDILVDKMRKQLQDHIDNGDSLLDIQEIKIIFGNLPNIYEGHCSLKKDLDEIAINWETDQIKIGKVFIDKFVDDKFGLRKAYKRFIQNFEETKKHLIECDQSNSRFHAFLKKCQCWKECKRQTLQELLIRPVQRLPSLLLLLKDLSKKTSENDPIYLELQKTLDCFQELIEWINEDKRQFDGKIGVLNVLNEVENFPSELVSSQKRSFVWRCDVMDMEAKLSRKELGLFLFTDTLLICKKRTFSSVHPFIRSPSTLSLQTLKSLTHKTLQTYYKPYKFLLSIDLLFVVQIAELIDNYKSDKEVTGEQKETISGFAIRVNYPGNSAGWNWYAFEVASFDGASDDMKKLFYLLKNQIAIIQRIRTDEVSCIISSRQYLNLSPRNNNSLLMDLVSRTCKVGRNFSFRTPTKRLSIWSETKDGNMWDSLSISADNLKMSSLSLSRSTISVPNTPKLQHKKIKCATLNWKIFNKKFSQS